MPVSTTSRANSSRIQRFGDARQTTRARTPNSIHDRNDVRCESIGLLDLNPSTECRSLLCVARVAELRPLPFPRSERSFGALRDEPPLLLRECGIEVEH